MTTLLITPNPDRKTARFKGTIAAGEHVSVTVKDGAEWNEEGLTLRVIDFTTMRTLAVFPRPAEVLEDGEEPDAWGTTQSGDLTCTLNLNTVRMVNAARHMINVPVLFVLGNSDEDSRTLYFRDRYEVELWPERIGDDVPYDLDKWPKQIDEWTDQMDELARQMQTFGEALTAEAEARASGDAPLSGQVINTNTTNALRQAVKTIGAALGATMRVLAVSALPVLGAEVQTAPLGDLDLDQNPSVVTNVTLDGVAMSSNTYTKAETDAKVAESEPGNYNAVSNAAMHAVQNKQGRIRIENNPRISWDAYDVQYLHLATDRRGWEFVYDEFGSLFLPIKFGDHTAATLSDLAAAANDATNYTDEAIANIYIPDPDLSEYAKLYTVEAVSNKVETTAAIVNLWESYWGATNVELSVSDYGNTTGALPRLRIREFRDGHWTNVWDEIDKFIACKAEILHEVAQSNATLLAEADRKYAPKAWGSHTDKGTTNVIPNSVYMTSPETYFGGGTEFQRVAVGSGAVSVLVDRGALAKTTGEPGTFRFQDAGGTNYFGFVKSDSYTIGCRTDGISVGAGNAITLRYDVIMAGEDVPVVYWKQRLESATPWAQLNNPDGTAADGAPYAVTWLQDGGSYYATVNCGGSPGGFFVAETSVAGDVVWETNMKARLGGGIECTNTATHVNGVIHPKFNGTSVTWEWSAR